MFDINFSFYFFSEYILYVLNYQKNIFVMNFPFLRDSPKPPTPTPPPLTAKSLQDLGSKNTAFKNQFFKWP